MAIEYQAALIVEVAQGSQLERSMREDPPPVGGPTEMVIVGLAAKGGHIDAPLAGQVVLSVPSVEALADHPEAVRRAIRRAPAGIEPVVIAVEEAEALRAAELRPIVEAASGARRPVILRVMNTS